MGKRIKKSIVLGLEYSILCLGIVISSTTQKTITLFFGIVMILSGCFGIPQLILD